MARKTKTAPKTDAPSRGRGRPATWPGKTLVAVLTNIPSETQEMLRAVAKKRGENINLTMHRLIERGFKDAFRSASK